MAKLEFVDNSRDPRHVLHPKGASVRWCQSANNNITKTNLVAIVTGYSVCTLVGSICAGCMNEGYQLDENSRKFCAGWKETYTGVEEHGWWERTT